MNLKAPPNVHQKNQQIFTAELTMAHENLEIKLAITSECSAANLIQVFQAIKGNRV